MKKKESNKKRTSDRFIDWIKLYQNYSYFSNLWDKVVKRGRDGFKDNDSYIRSSWQD